VFGVRMAGNPHFREAAQGALLPGTSRPRIRANHPFGRAATDGIEHAVVARSRHADEIDVTFDRLIQNRVDDISAPDSNRSCRVTRCRCSASHVQQMHRNIGAGQQKHQASCRFNRSIRQRGVVDGYENTAEPEIAGAARKGLK
jgi:hypothetical protein